MASLQSAFVIPETLPQENDFDCNARVAKQACT